MSSVWAGVGATCAAVGIIGVLARISFQLGSLVTEFRLYVKVNDKVVSDIARKVELLERRRR